MARLVVVVLCALLCGAWRQPGVSQAAIGHQAYNDLIGRFWYGTSARGYIVNLAQSGAFGNPATNPVRVPLAQQPGWLWQYAQAVNAVYAYWKATGSTDARNRLVAQWSWMQRFYAGASYSGCGTGTVNTASDDAAWTAMLLLQIHEATSDVTALNGAKSLLDCGLNRWSDDGSAGCSSAAVSGAAIWYDDTCTSKSSYQAVFALGLYTYYQRSGDSTYRTKAVAIDSWLATNLQRLGQTVNANTYPNDGLYWVTMRPTGSPAGISTPYNIQPASSVVLLAGDMAATVLCARLYAEGGIGAAGYMSRIQAAADGIAAHETDGSGRAFSARDARVDGWAAYYYAAEVVPLLNGGFGRAGFAATARAVHDLDRGTDRTYGGSWSGPPDGTDVWSTSLSLLPQQVEMTANAVMWAIANLALQ